MAKNKKFNVRMARKRKGLTNYKKRLALLKSKEKRIVVRKSLNNLHIQIVEFHEKGDKIILSANTKELAKKFGWKANRGNIPSAYLTGLLCGIRAKKKNIKKAIADFGLQPAGLRLYAAVKGAIDAGLDVPASKDVLPAENVIKGENISKYAKQTNGVQFSRYVKNNLKVEDLGKHFEETKKRIKENA